MPKASWSNPCAGLSSVPLDGSVDVAGWPRIGKTATTMLGGWMVAYPPRRSAANVGESTGLRRLSRCLTVPPLWFMPGAHYQLRYHELDEVRLDSEAHGQRHPSAVGRLRALLMLRATGICEHRIAHRLRQPPCPKAHRCDITDLAISRHLLIVAS
jgi:hypothetical protein